MAETALQIQAVDSQSVDALALFRKRRWKRGSFIPNCMQDPNAPPKNLPTPPRGIYLLVYDDAKPVGRRALRPIDEYTVEIRRIYSLKEYRRHGVARMILEALEQEAARLQYTLMRLEAGNRQTAAI
jgi:GNAT superfamily N-acetyltransferase